MGELQLLDAGNETLAAFAQEWFRLYAQPNLSRRTLESYASSWDKHVLPRLGTYRLRELTPRLIESFRAEEPRSGWSGRTGRTAARSHTAPAGSATPARSGRPTGRVSRSRATAPARSRHGL
jgi:hypothetical protein